MSYHKGLLKVANRVITKSWPAKLSHSKLSSAVATICFDDFPRSAWTVGGSILEDFGVRGSYFVSAAFSPERLRMQPAAGSIPAVEFYELEDIVEAHERGHEIGCHTYDHINVPLLNNAELEHSLLLNAEFFRSLLGDVPITSFAYPQGSVNVRTKHLCAKNFTVCRGTHFGLNSGIIDLALLRSIALNDTFSPDTELDRLIANAKLKKAWLIFYTHDISDAPSPWGCTSRIFEQLVTKLLDNDIDIITLKAGANRVLKNR
jgi:peptidoglycan/xylan/chitin deacetylase (PgdA/CDA1 family)